jgi:pimeloyl-ACP methyl ester carboxylesterase
VPFVGALTLDHRRAGKGDPLVLIHGIGSTWRMWEPVLPALEARHDVLALSLPGYGRSEPVEGEPTVPALADAVEEAMDAAGLDTAHVVGNSMGGCIASDLARRGRARSVVAISPAGLWTPREWRYSYWLLRLTHSVTVRNLRFVLALVGSAAGRTWLLCHVSSRPWRMDPENARHQVEVLARSPSFRRTLEWWNEGPHNRTPDFLGEISVPYLVAWGTRDLLLPPRQAERWQRLVPGAELTWLPKLGHLAAPDDPDLVSRTILEFVERAARRSPERPAAARA